LRRGVVVVVVFVGWARRGVRRGRRVVSVEIRGEVEVS